jgi:hypothetical protein
MGRKIRDPGVVLQPWLARHPDQHLGEAMGEAHAPRAFQVVARDDIERLIGIVAVEQLLDRLGGVRAECCRGTAAGERENGEQRYCQRPPQGTPP